LLHSHENQPKFIWQNGWIKIFMFSLVSRKFLAMRNIVLYSVYLFFLLVLLFKQSRSRTFKKCLGGTESREESILRDECV
jgi:hypothetical protein